MYANREIKKSVHVTNIVLFSVHVMVFTLLFYMCRYYYIRNTSNVYRCVVCTYYLYFVADKRNHFK